jgi:hypothetical protein
VLWHRMLLEALLVLVAVELTQWNFGSVRQSFAASCCVGWRMRCEHCSSMRLKRTSCGLPPGGGRFGNTTVIVLPRQIHISTSW